MKEVFAELLRDVQGYHSMMYGSLQDFEAIKADLQIVQKKLAVQINLDEKTNNEKKNSTPSSSSSKKIANATGACTTMVVKNAATLAGIQAQEVLDAMKSRNIAAQVALGDINFKLQDVRNNRTIIFKEIKVIRTLTIQLRRELRLSLIPEQIQTVLARMKELSEALKAYQQSHSFYKIQNENNEN